MDYSDSERRTLHRQSVGRHRGRAWPRNAAQLGFMGWIISYANEWEDYFIYFGKGRRLPGIGSLPTPWSFNSALELRTSLVAQRVKHLPTMRETQVQSLGWEDLLEKEMATHSSILAWKIPWMEDSGKLQSMGSQRVGHD